MTVLDEAEMSPEQKQAKPVDALKTFKWSDVQNLIHTFDCDDENCSVEGCVEMRIITNHYDCCKRRMSGGCPMCRQFHGISLLHSEDCELDPCPLPECEDLRSNHKGVIKRRLQTRYEEAVAAAMKRMEMRYLTARLLGDLEKRANPKPPSQDAKPLQSVAACCQGLVGNVASRSVPAPSADKAVSHGGHRRLMTDHLWSLLHKYGYVVMYEMPLTLPQMEEILDKCRPGRAKELSAKLAAILQRGIAAKNKRKRRRHRRDSSAGSPSNRGAQPACVIQPKVPSPSTEASPSKPAVQLPDASIQQEVPCLSTEAENKRKRKRHHRDSSTASPGNPDARIQQEVSCLSTKSEDKQNRKRHFQGSCAASPSNPGAQPAALIQHKVPSPSTEASPSNLEVQPRMSTEATVLMKRKKHFRDGSSTASPVKPAVRLAALSRLEVLSPSSVKARLRRRRTLFPDSGSAASLGIQRATLAQLEVPSPAAEETLRSRKKLFRPGNVAVRLAYLARQAVPGLPAETFSPPPKRICEEESCDDESSDVDVCL